MLGLFKKTFDANLLTPQDGVISGMYFSNPHVGIETTLFLKIEINIRPFQYKGITEDTSVVLDFVRIPFKSYRDLENRAFTFPLNPEDGYIDGSLYVQNMHNPFDVSQIKFGNADNKSIEVDVSGKLNFEDGSIKPTALTIISRLHYADILIYCEKLLELGPVEIHNFIIENLDTRFFNSKATNNYITVKG